MSIRRVWAEVQRQYVRRHIFFFLGGAAIALAAAALVFGFGLAHDAYLWAAAFVLPLVLLPATAWLATRDRERGLARIYATTRLSKWEAAGGLLLAVLLMQLTVAAIAIPVTLMVAAPVGSGFRTHALAFVPWGLAVGVAATFAGLLVGHASAGRPVKALGISFTLGVAWFVLPRAAPSLIAPVEDTLLAPVVIAILHMSPLMWALDALTVHEGFQAVGGMPPAWGVTLLTLTLAGGWLAVVHRQDEEGWRARRSRRGFATAAVLAVAAGVLIGGASPAFAERGDGVTPYVPRNGLTVTTLMERGTPTLLNGGIVTQKVILHGEPGAVVEISEISAASATLTLSVLERPSEITLDRFGGASFNVTFRAEPKALEGKFARVLTAFDLNGERYVTDDGVAVGPGYDASNLPLAPLIVGTGVAAGALGGVAGVIVPRRMNKW